MKLAHFSDTHLGFRQFAKVTGRGINQREADVAQSFSRTIDTCIAINPAVVLIGGDIFHAVKPPNAAIEHAYAEFARLRRHCPAAVIVMVAGNHDTPRSSEVSNILGLFRSALGIHVVKDAPRTFDFPALDLEILGVADAMHERPTLKPTGKRKYNLLVLHGEAHGISPKGTPAAAKELSDDDLHVREWDYVALGHYHVYREIAPNCYYSGAIDYTSSDIWGERREEKELHYPGKRVIERNLVTGEHIAHELEPTRLVLDIPAIDVRGLPAAEVDRVLADVVGSIPGGVGGHVVRVTLTNVEREVRHALDMKQQRKWRHDAVHFQINTVAPETARGMIAVGSVNVVTPRRRGVGLEAEVADHMARRELPADLDRAELTALALRYLADTEDKSPIPMEPVTA